MTPNEQSLIAELLQCIPAAFFRQKAGGEFEEISGGFELLTGLAANAVLAEPSLLLRRIHERDVEAFQKRASRGEASESTSIFRLWHGQIGELKTIQEFRRPSPGGQGTHGLWVDKTDWAKLGRRLEVGAWKQVLSTISLGIAHDFNNALTGLNGMSDLLLAQTDAKHPFREPLQVIQQSVKKANDLVRRLNHLHQSGPGKPDYCDLGQITLEALDSLYKVTPSHVKVNRLIDPKPLPVFADSWRVRLVIIELFLNATEAMKEAGTLEVQTSREQEGPNGPAAFGVLSAGPWVRLRIQAHGRNYAHELGSLPTWFTTKAAARGAGLGLFIVRKFCEENGAALFVNSSKDTGTVVDLWLKEADFTEAQAMAVAQKRLLIGGDDKQLRSELASHCKADGYSAIVSPSLASMTGILAVNPEEFDAIILAGEPKEWQGVFDWVRSGKLPFKIVLLTPSEHAHEADLVMPYSGPETFLRRLKALFG
jgi:signal transduction histidine kinase